MDIAFCYENVCPSRGGCEMYIASLARRLAADGHTVHLYACRWDASALPGNMQFHPLSLPGCPRFLRPWLFSRACLQALAGAPHQVSIGFDKTWGQDVQYPQGGLYSANVQQNIYKHRRPWVRRLVRALKLFDPTHWSYRSLERRQYLGQPRPLVVAISDMVQRHFEHFLEVPPEDVRVVRIATDPNRFDEHDRPRRRIEARDAWEIDPGDTVGLFVGINAHLKGLEPLLYAIRLLPRETRFRLLVVGNSQTREFTRLAHRLQISDRVRFAGYCTDMRDPYFAADLLVHPTFYDPCSHVVPEALACGLPVITSRFNGASEFLHPPREGYVIDDPHDHQHLAWCLMQLMDPARRSSCAQAARKATTQWTFEHHYRQMLAVFQEAEARKRAA
jgi:UDP-glucose:(heptosyl)LPS alpha-1,3-glucosyltransferase